MIPESTETSISVEEIPSLPVKRGRGRPRKVSVGEIRKSIKDIGDLHNPSILFEKIEPGKRRGRPPKVKVTDGQAKFAIEFVNNGGNATKAYQQAYPNNSISKGDLNKRASECLRSPGVKKLIEEIQQECRTRFIHEAMDAFDRLLYLSKFADSEKVKLDANIEILDRSGLKAPERVELTTLGAFGNAAPEEIRQEVKKRQEERLAALARAAEQKN